MNELKEQIRSCTKCALYKKMPEGCRPVPGIGPLDAKLMILGEALGKDESIMEEPFVGLCGKFLTKCMEQAGIKREACYITNCVKCRPTENSKKNRPPNEDELISCLPWLWKEIDLVRPKVVLGLGNFAMKTLMGNTTKIKMKDIIGSFGYRTIRMTDDFGFATIYTYHPSYIQNYSQGKVDLFIEHLTKARKLAYGE